MTNLYRRTCTRCSQDLTESDLDGPCPACGSKQFRIEFTTPMVLGPGSTVEIPMLWSDPTKTVVTLTDNSPLTLTGEQKEYPFAPFKRIKKVDGGNWVVIKPCRDRRRLDVLFGRQSDGAAHSHYAYAAQTRDVFVRPVDGTQIVRTLAFDGKEGAFMPLVDRIDDRTTGTSVEISFTLREDAVVLTEVRFFETDKEATSHASRPAS